jgi:hypothetical protein
MASTTAATAANAGDFGGLTTSFSLRNSSMVFKQPSGMLAAKGQPVGGKLRSAMSYTFSSNLTGPFGAVGASPAAGGAAAATWAAYITPAPAGSLLYDDVRVRYEGSGSIAIGFYRGSDQELVLNPVKGAWCEAGDVLVAISHSAGEGAVGRAIKAIATAAGQCGVQRRVCCVQQCSATRTTTVAQGVKVSQGFVAQLMGFFPSLHPALTSVNQPCTAL